MTPLGHLAAVELRRFRRSRLTRGALLALVAIPLLYGALYLWAFWNPSGRLADVPVALVDADRPAAVAGRTVHAGQDLRDDLRSGKGGFDWHVTDAADAAEGLADGRYHLVVTVPEDFSASLVSVGGGDPRPAVLRVRTDDANGYLTSQLARTVLAEIRHAVATGSTKQYLENVYVSLAELHDRIGEAADGAGSLAGGARSARDGAVSLADGARTLAAGASELTAGADAATAGATRLAGGAAALARSLDSLDAGASRLSGRTRSLAAGAARVAAGADQVAALGTQLGRARGQLDAARADARQLAGAVAAYAAAHPDDAAAQQLAADARARAGAVDARLASVSGGLRTAAGRTAGLAAGAHQVSRGASALAAAAPALARGVHRAEAGARSLAAGAGTLAGGTRTLATGARSLGTGARGAAGGAASLAAGMTTLDDGARTLADGLATATTRVPRYTGQAAAARAGVAADPVELRTEALNQARTYGEGMAPYFIPLALWVGALVISMLLRPLGARSLASSAPAPRVTVAGWLPAAALGLLQAGALLAVLRYGLGLGAEHPWALVAFLAVVAVSFAALLQWIGAQFGFPGRLVALVLLVLQLASAGGTYPIETAPALFRWLHPLLPMSYVVTGLRHLLTGGPPDAVWRSTGALAAFAALALVATMLAARRQRVWTLRRLHPELTG